MPVRAAVRTIPADAASQVGGGGDTQIKVLLVEEGRKKEALREKFVDSELRAQTLAKAQRVPFSLTSGPRHSFLW